jgi:hypothetical protein
MTHHTFGHLACTVIAIALACGSVALATPLPSSSFNHQYNGDVYNATQPKLTGPGFSADEMIDVTPDPNYNPTILTSEANTFDGKALAFKSPVSGGAGAWFNLAPDWIANASNAVGWTIEFRIKIGTDEPDDDTFGAFRFFAKENLSSSSTRRVEFRVGQDFTRIGNVNVTVDTNDNTNDYHDFRVMQPANSGSITVWRDGVQIYSGNSSNSNNTGQDFWIGDGSGSSAGGPTVYLDYFRWDSTGPYEYEASTIPEPSSFVLLGIAGMGLIGLARRRRDFPSKRPAN